MQTLTPLKSVARLGSGGAWTGPSVPGAPQGPVPWSRRWAAVAAGVSPPGGVDVEEAAAGRQADIGEAGVLARVAEAPEVVARARDRPTPRVHSVPSVIRLEMAVPPGNGATA